MCLCVTGFPDTVQVYKNQETLLRVWIIGAATIVKLQVVKPLLLCLALFFSPWSLSGSHFGHFLGILPLRSDLLWKSLGLSHYRLSEGINPLPLPLFQMEINGFAGGRVPFGYRINLRAALVKMHNHKLDNAIHSQSSIFPTCSPSFPYGVTFTQFITFLLIFQVSLKVMEFYFYYKSNKNKY